MQGPRRAGQMRKPAAPPPSPYRLVSRWVAVVVVAVAWMCFGPVLPVDGVPLSNQKAAAVADANIDLVKSSTIKIHLPNEEYLDFRGSAMGKLSDLDENGVDDLVVGAYADDTIALDAGAIYVLYLQANNTQPFLHYAKVTSGRGGFQYRLEREDYFGCAVAGISDVNGDGVPDMLVGALGDGDVAANAGAVYLLFLQRNTLTPVWDAVKVTQGQGGFTAALQKNNFFGSSVCALGDLDGNGVSEVAVGAYGEDKVAGAVYILYLQNSRTRPVKAFFKIKQNTGGFQFGLMANDAFGVSVAPIGDLDGDGVHELAIGAYMDSTTEVNAGAVYLLLMRTTDDDAQLGTVSPIKSTVKITSGLANFTDHLVPKAFFGAALTATTDMDNDGVSELAVSAVGDNQANTDAGALYILYLKRNLPNGLPTIKRVRKITTGVQGFKPQLVASEMFGAAVVELPDLDGDNVTELAVGSYMEQAAPIYVVYKNNLNPVTVQLPKIFTVTPPVLSTYGGELVTLHVSLDIVALNVSMPMAATVTIGEEKCLVDPDQGLKPYVGKPWAGQTMTVDQRPYIITCTSPPGVGGKLAVVATLRQGTVEEVLAYAQSVNYHVPVVTSVAPTRTWARGGFDITVMGSSFGVKDYKPLVIVNGMPCASTNWVSDSSVVCEGAPGGLGEAMVQVSVSGQLSPALPTKEGSMPPGITFTYDKPRITSWNISDPMTVFLPIYNEYRLPLVYSPYTGGEEVLQIWGENFGPAGSKAKVMLGAKECTQAHVQNDDRLTCLTPRGVGSHHPINVTLAGMTITYSYFAYGAPLLLTIIPDSGNADGGDMVIMGRNFGSSTEPHHVMIGDVNCDDIKVVYDYQLITCKYPAGSGKELQLVVSVGNQTNLPQTYGYTDVFGQRTVVVKFELQGESMATMGPGKIRAFEEILLNTLEADHQINMQEDAVHVTLVTPMEPDPGMETSPNAVALYTDVSVANFKVADQLVAWLRDPTKITETIGHLAQSAAGINVQQLYTVTATVSEEVYCSPGQQPQLVSATEKACFLCPVNTFQPHRSKAPCHKCPTGVNCTQEGTINPHPLPGFWRSPLKSPSDDPYFQDHPIYACDPPAVCLGGPNSQCSEGHIQGSPLCAVCQPRWYLVAGDCHPCGPKRNLQITIYFALAVFIFAFFVLLYFWVRPGADIDEAAAQLKEKFGDDGPNAAAFHAALSMRTFLSSTMMRDLSTRMSSLTNLPDVWSKAKISVTFLQITASLNVAYKVPWPPGFKKMLDRISVINMNILNLPGLSYSCVARVDFFSEFLLAITLPIILTLVFLLVYYLGRKAINRKVANNAAVVESLELQASELKSQLVARMRSLSLKRKKKKGPSDAGATAADASGAQNGTDVVKDQTTTAGVGPSSSSNVSSPLTKTPPVSPPLSPEQSNPSSSPSTSIASTRDEQQDGGAPAPASVDSQSENEEEEGQGDGSGSEEDAGQQGESGGRMTQSHRQDEEGEEGIETSGGPPISQPSPTVRSTAIDIFSPRPQSETSTPITAPSSSHSTCSSSSSQRPNSRPRRRATFQEEAKEIKVPSFQAQQSIGDILMDDCSMLELKQKVAVLEKQEDVETFSIEQFQARLITLWFWIILLIYPSVSRIVLEAVNCRTLDRDLRLLVVDYNIDCDSKYYRSYLALIGPALVVYPFGIPLIFFLMLLYKRNSHPWDYNLSFLYKSYKPKYWWFEVYELLRKLILTGLIIFVANGTATQLAIACILCMVSICVHFRLSPYNETFDDLLQSFSLAELLTMTYCALLLKLDLTGSDHTSVMVFDYVLLVTNAVVVLGIMPASFFVKSRQWFQGLLDSGKPTLASLMKREAFNRLAVAMSLILAVWSSIANSVTDHLTRACTVIGLMFFAMSIVQVFYFVPQVQLHIPERYRCLYVLDPVNCLTGEEEEEMQLDKLAMSSSGKHKSSRDLSRSSVRRMNSRRRSRSGDSGDAKGAGRPYLMRNQKSLNASLSQGTSNLTDLESSEGPWFSTQVFYTAWLLAVRKRRTIDAVAAVSFYVLALVLYDYGVGNTNYTRILMLGVALVFTLVLLAFPHVKDRTPPLISPLRLAQLLLASSTLVLVVLEITDDWSGSTVGLLVEISALVVSALTALHALAGITHGLNITLHMSRLGAGAGQRNLRRADSVYGSLTVNRSRMDGALLLAMLVVVIGMFVSQERPQYISSTAIILAQAALFMYKPLRAAQRYQEEMITQLLLLKSLIMALVSQPKKTGTEDEERDAEDERRLRLHGDPQALAAEVIKLRRKVQELESR